jgi:glycosyltransferase involved in cell wall biosynthesis
MALRIGINALFLIPGEVGGTEIYVRFLLDALARIDPANEYFVFFNRETGPDLLPPSLHFHAVPCAVRAKFRSARILFEQIRLPGLLARCGVDVLLNPGFTSPLAARCPQVTVFHDLQHKVHPEFFRRLDLPFWNFLLAGSASHSDRLIAVSANTASDLAQTFPRSADKIAAIPHGVDPEFFRIGQQRLGRSPQPFVLIVSTLHPHKNLERTLDAFRDFRIVHPEFRLVIAGLKGFATYSIQNRVRDLRLWPHVDVTGWIPRSRLYELFGNATAFLAPSLFEGFGLPLVEAMAAGLPVACSAIPPFRETAEGIARMFDPHSPDEIGAALEFVTCNNEFRARASIEGPRRARAFDWDACARATLAELNRLVRERTPATNTPPAPTRTAALVPALPGEEDRTANPTLPAA